MAKIRIAAAIASQHGITLYLEDGREQNLPTTSWRTKAILDDVLKRLAHGEIVEIDPDTYSIEARVEKETKGLIRFVRKTKSFVKGLFGKQEDEANTETVVVSPPDPVKPVVVAAAPAAPAPAAKVEMPKVEAPKEEETELVAIVTDKKTGKETFIPGVQALEKHVEAAVLSNNVKGVQRFMERLAGMQQKRSHTVQELMRFMERGDLPIADDGCIVAYKVLKSSAKAGVFLDCHSSRVEQRVGSKVMQDESLIDQNRRNECSTGLHIARRGYLGGFSGDIMTIVKVAPEDVVAVPDYDANKMRAAAYHIVGELPAEVHDVLRSNKPMTSNVTAAKILADVIAGRHIGVIEHVRITAAKGGSFVTTPIGDGGEERAGESGASQLARALDAPVEGLKPADIRAAVEETVAAKKQEEAVQEAAATGDLSAAITTEPEPVETKAQRDARRKRERRAAAKSTKAAAPAAAPAPKVVKQAAKVNVATKLPEKHQKVLEMHKAGKSAREIEKELHICRKTIRRLLSKSK